MHFNNYIFLFFGLIVVLHNIINILGKHFLKKKYVNGQPNAKTYSIMFTLILFISLIASQLLSDTIFITKIKINIYLKYFLTIVYILLLAYLNQLYLKKTNNIIYVKNKKWYEMSKYPKYNIETSISQIIVLFHFAWIVYILPKLK